jgi:hypothetical protein
MAKKSTLEERIRRAQQVVAKWPPHKVALMRLQGSDASPARREEDRRQEQQKKQPA